ncbi:DUF2235 domain-containing protein [Ralstonia solanacearum]|uniref:T6SS phospholipase effector Tle1-like catalytic domain-containing protein n=1 Tax=Ralstonia solanacearum TaxID=305 RepID=UPI0005C52CA1|nr:DUF2235 domain-containing protein [Ralstonia solanacearum]MBB6597926.1 DUF2235 domain-containing protein [Ralstonia solanacearum]MDB0543141.1 DUF2235 domain-containing protein [Ralstonia solanacearum]MDB0553310.1 DUF2235 domain-containing protein [Ralstonia solanacearum]MDB0558120.1 DUF2235 domain-containing protein [Ralstonia solanacearum]
MSAFRPGWYEVGFDAATRDRHCRYFKSPSAYTAECLVKSTGQQILLWSDPAGPDGVGQPAQWQPAYRPLAGATTDDWWNHPPGGANYRPELPPSGSRTQRKPTLKELCERAATADFAGKRSLSCSREIHVGLFFDGTNNNMVRDTPSQSHTNVVVLFNAHRDDRQDHFAFYVPGVGTKFPEIGEAEELDAGKTYAAGGEARIHWGMLQVFNAVHTALCGTDLLDQKEMKHMVTSTAGLSTWWRVGDEKMVRTFGDLQKRLLKAIDGKRPRVTKVHLSVFGFSRGAAQARTCCQWIRKATGMRVGEAALNMRFLGIFDTVASVGLADSSPVGQGFLDWADGTMDIGDFERVVHFVAAHEIRQSFPLSTARIGSKHYPPNTKEFVYPGAHSDVGGGYAPGAQGKATGGRSELLSQIPLLDMYVEARNAGVKLLGLNEMRPEVQADFVVAPTLDKAFSDYSAWTGRMEKQDVAAGNVPPIQNRMQYHTQLYWRWRTHISSDAAFKALSSYTHASTQDKTDLFESELDWRRDVSRAQEASKTRHVARGRGAYVAIPPPATGLQKQIVAQVNSASQVTPGASAFFDRHVHDSHAGFWLLGPITSTQRLAFITNVKAKKTKYDALLRRAQTPGNPHADQQRSAALAYELNGFERRVLASDASSAGSVPVMSDADAADLRANAGIATSAALWILGTETRREPHGHGRYRRIFDHG